MESDPIYGAELISTSVTLRVGNMVAHSGDSTFFFNSVPNDYTEGGKPANGSAYVGGAEIFVRLNRIATDTSPHEWGHAIGLNHSGNFTGSIMSYDHTWGLPRSVTFSDRTRVQALYGGR